MSYTLETARAGQSRAEAADAGEHIKISDQVISFLQGKQKAEDAFIYIPGSAAILRFFFGELHSPQLLPDGLANGIQQFLLPFILTDHAADRGGALPRGDLRQLLPRPALYG